MPEPRSLEEWVNTIDLGYIEGNEWQEVVRYDIVKAARAYAEQEVAKVVSEFNADLLAGAERENELHNEKDAKITTLQAERDALLAVARAKFELSDNASYAGKAWGYRVDEEDILQLRAVLARPIVQRLMKENG